MRKIKFIFKIINSCCLHIGLLMFSVAALWSGSGFRVYAAQDLITTHITAQGRSVKLTVDIAKDSQVTSGRIKIHYPQDLLGLAEVQGGNLWEICDANTEMKEGDRSVASFAWADTKKCTEEGNILTVTWEAEDMASGKEIIVETEVDELYSQEKRVLLNQDKIIDKIHPDFPMTGHIVRTGDESDAAGLALLCLGTVVVMTRLLRIKIKE